MTQNIAACQCRASWKVKHDNLLLARRLISSKRFYMDNALARIPGVLFFIGTLSNSKAQAMFKDSSYEFKTFILECHILLASPQMLNAVLT